MPYTPEHTRHTRKRIVESASRLVRRRGVAGAGVDGIMAGAGLSAGGFYAHFPKKDALVAEVVDAGFRSLSTMLFAGLENVRGAPFLAKIAQRYLSRKHRDDLDGGCIVSALLGEMPRMGQATRATFDRNLKETLGAIAPRLPASSTMSAHDRGLATLALFAGGIMLARAVEDPELSDRILAASRKAAAWEKS